jgi:hypothetical protein
MKERMRFVTDPRVAGLPADAVALAEASVSDDGPAGQHRRRPVGTPGLGQEAAAPPPLHPSGGRARDDPLTVADRHTRFLLGCQGLLSTQGQGVRPIFDHLFREYGLPKAIRTDNGVPFATTGKRLLFIANSLKQQVLGLEEVGDGVWSIYFCRVLLARVDERDYILRP